MTRPLLQDSYQPIDQSHISRCERAIGRSIPKWLRSLLLVRNGGWYQQRASYPDRDDEGEVYHWSISCVLGIETGEKICEIEFIHNYGLPEAANGEIPIATHRLGGTFTVTTNGKNCIKYYGDYEDEGHVISQSPEKFFDEIVFAPDISEDWHESIPAFMAIERGNVDRLNLLVSRENVNKLQNADGEYLLHCAARCCWPNFVSVLLKLGADVNLCDTSGSTALYHACQNDSFDSTRLLVANGTNVNQGNAAGDTPLFMAISRCQARLVELLIVHGCDVTVRTIHGDSALDLSLLNNEPEITDLIRKALTDFRP